MAGAKGPLTIVDCSTSEPTLTIALHGASKAKGVDICDAPLGGTPANAEAGTLSAMVGAEPEVFERVAPVIGAFATKVTHVGAPGAGHTLKLLNNFLSLGYGAIYAEALALAAKVGVTPQTFDSVIRGSRMDCGFYQTFMTYVLERDVNATASRSPTRTRTCAT